MIQKFLLIILLFSIVGCTNNDDGEYIIFKKVDIQAIVEKDSTVNCTVDKSGEKFCYDIETGPVRYTRLT